MDSAELVRREPFGDNPNVGARGASTRHSILDAALGVFAEHGYHDARVELITEAAGCSRPAFYQYFASRQDVFWRLAGHLGRDIAEGATALTAVDSTASGCDHLVGWVDEFVDTYQHYEPVFAAFPAAFREQPEHDVPLPKSIADRFQDLIGAAGTVKGNRARDIAETLSATVVRSTAFWHAGVGDVDRARFCTGLADAVHRTLFGPLPGVNMSPASGRPRRHVPAWPDLSGEFSTDGLRARGRATRRALLDAASVVLPRRGLREARVDDVVSEAGVSHGTFYRYFDNVDDLYRTLSIEAAATMADLFDRFPDDPDDLPAWLRSWFEEFRRNGGVISTWQELGLADSSAAMSLETASVYFDRMTRAVAGRGFGDTVVDALVLMAVVEQAPNRVVVHGADISRGVAAADHVIRYGVLGRP